MNAFEFVDNASASINSMMKQGLFSTGTKASAETSQKYVEQSFQISLMKIRDGFEKAFMSVNLKNQRFCLWMALMQDQEILITNSILSVWLDW